MIDLDRLLAMQKENAELHYDKAEYVNKLLADAPALLEAAALMREAIRLYPFSSDPYGECYFCTGEFRRHDEGCLWGKLAALLGKE